MSNEKLDQYEISKEEILDFINNNKEQESKEKTEEKETLFTGEDAKTLLNIKNKEPEDSALQEVRFNIKYEPNRIFKTDTSIKYADVIITDLEKELFLRSILLGIPFRLEFSLGNKNIKLDISSITERDRETIESFSITHQLSLKDKQYLYLSFMLKRFLNDKINLNEKDFFKSIENAKTWLDKKESFVKEFIFKTLDIFELKLKKLTDSLSNEDFWKPQD